MEPRLTSEFWVHAHIARLRSADIPVFVTRRGDPTAGAVMVKLNHLDGTAEAFARATGPDGRRGWSRLTGQTPSPDAEAEAAIARQGRYDPDLWVIEIEDRAGRHMLDDPIF